MKKNFESYIVYVNNNCSGCVKLLQALSNIEAPYNVINIDQDQKTSDTPLVFPALYRQDKLIAYGDDIIKVLAG